MDNPFKRDNLNLYQSCFIVYPFLELNLCKISCYTKPKLCPRKAYWKKSAIFYPFVILERKTALISNMVTHFLLIRCCAIMKLFMRDHENVFFNVLDH